MAEIPDTLALAELIATGIVAQLGEDAIDNLGDAESILFTEKLPSLNLVELAEFLCERLAAPQISRK